MVCECEGPGIESLTTNDILMLLKTFKGLDTRNTMMRIALKLELAKRTQTRGD